MSAARLSGGPAAALTFLSVSQAAAESPARSPPFVPRDRLDLTARSETYAALFRRALSPVNDGSRPGEAPLASSEAGAPYNYLLIARGGAGGVHNPLYTMQLMFDSYVAVTGMPPSTMPTRPAP